MSKSVGSMIEACHEHSELLYNAMKNAIIYHRVDWDGYTSAAVAKKAFPDAVLIGWSYGDYEPNVSHFDRIIVVDLSLSEEWMRTFASKLIWIDHHKNVIDALQSHHELNVIPGIRRDGIGACALAWEYFFPRQEMPIHVRLAATADVMDRTHQLASLEDALHYGLYLDEFGPGWTKGAGDISKTLVDQATRLFDTSEASEGLMRGERLEQNRANHEDELFRDAREIMIDDRIVSLLHIDGRPNACILSHLLANTHDAFICIGDFLADKGKYKISVRVPYESDFDASAFCRQYGGNGHIKAAGCLMSAEEIEALDVVV